MSNRRQFLELGLALSGARLLRAQSHPSEPRETSRPDVAGVDREHILATSSHALALAPSLSLDTGAIPALAAGSLLLKTTAPEQAERMREHGRAWLRYLFAAPQTSLNNTLTETNHPEDVVALAPLAEIAQAVPFLLPHDDPSATELRRQVDTWFAGLLASFNSSRTGGLARDHRDHVAGVWLLVASASARLTADDHALAALRHLFKTAVVRAQISAEGTFPHELTTRDPYRNSLFALDLLAASCDLLSTRFESLWTYELQDGPGLRAAVAKHAPWIADRNTWPYLADQTYFHDLPCRRPALLLAARSYERPEYAAIWRALEPAEPTVPALLAAFPVRQPLLWVTRSQA